ncbi:MAG: GAF domain-containing protein [Elusimicrobia bacterium]|nr:GAF domain-containing protein [Elusimicrobiota bacterium]
MDGPRGRAAQGSVIDAGEGGGSRICVPVLDQRGEAWAMLAVESARAGAFNEVDRRWLERMLKALAQLPRPSSP